MRARDFTELDVNIARGRVVLSLVAILSVYIDPATGGIFYLSRYALVTLCAHLVYSFGAYLAVSRRLGLRYLPLLSTTLDVYRDGEKVATLHPEKNFYFASQQPTTEVAIYGMLSWPPHLGDDLYTLLVDPNPQEGGYLFKAYLNPLVSWIWLGGLVVILGTHVAVLPEWKKERSAARKPAVQEASGVAS